MPENESYLTTPEQVVVDDAWREITANANEGCAVTLAQCEAHLIDAIEMLTYHGKEDTAGELRRCASAVRLERNTFLERAALAREAVDERRNAD